MEKERLKYYATDNCVKEVAEKYVDEYACWDLEEICKKKQKGRTFIMIEDAPSQQNPITTFRIEKCFNEFFGIKYISPFKVLLTQIQISLHTCTYILPRLFSKNSDEALQDPPFRLVNEIYSTQYIGHKITCLTLMIMALECFVNENIPSDINEGYDKKGEKKDKDYIERNYDLKSKMQIIMKYNKIVDPRYTTLVSTIIPLQKLRNDFVHLKSDKPNSLHDPCVNCYDKVLSMDLNLMFNKIKEYVKLVNPNAVLD